MGGACGRPSGPPTPVRAARTGVGRHAADGLRRGPGRVCRCGRAPCGGGIQGAGRERTGPWRGAGGALWAVIRWRVALSVPHAGSARGRPGRGLRAGCGRCAPTRSYCPGGWRPGGRWGPVGRPVMAGPPRARAGGARSRPPRRLTACVQGIGGGADALVRQPVRRCGGPGAGGGTGMGMGGHPRVCHPSPRPCGRCAHGVGRRGACVRGVGWVGGGGRCVRGPVRRGQEAGGGTGGARGWSSGAGRPRRAGAARTGAGGAGPCAGHGRCVSVWSCALVGGGQGAGGAL